MRSHLHSTRVLIVVLTVFLPFAPKTCHAQASVLNDRQKLTAYDGSPDDDFGSSVSMSDCRMAVGAKNVEEGAGAVYVFRREPTGVPTVPPEDPWVLGEKIGASYACTFQTAGLSEAQATHYQAA